LEFYSSLQRFFACSFILSFLGLPKIAAIAIVNNAIVLTRNTSDFGQIANLKIEDWTQ
jgi:hypothetical protein